MQGSYFYVSPFLISHNRDILVSLMIKLEIKDSLSCYCLSVKAIWKTNSINYFDSANYCRIHAKNENQFLIPQGCIHTWAY